MSILRYRTFVCILNMLRPSEYESGGNYQSPSAFDVYGTERDMVKNPDPLDTLDMVYIH
jgi:hypothetical protein